MEEQKNNLLLKDIEETQSVSDSLIKQEQVFEETTRLQSEYSALEIKRLETALEESKDKNKHRNFLVYWIAWLISIWLMAVVFILCHTELKENVQLMLLGTTTINILGLPNIILRGLFRDKEK